jgi:hypothetical protein
MGGNVAEIESLMVSDREGRKTLRVQAKKVLGPLVLHKSLGSMKSVRWSITHIASGGLVVETRTLAEALKVLAPLSRLDWSRVKSHQSKKALQEIAPLRLRILEEAGLR